MTTRQGDSPPTRILRSLLAVPIVALGMVAASSAPATAATRSTIVSIAQDELGDSSRNHEASSKCNFYTGYMRSWKPASGCPSSDGVQWRQSDWCADFAEYVWMKAGVSDADKGDDNTITGWAESFREYGVKHGTWHSRSSGYTPQPGDAIVFDWDGDDGIDHVGLVRSANSGTVYTIEGNTDDGRIASHSRSRSSGDIVGYSSPVGVDSEPMIGNSVTGDSYADLLAVDSTGKMTLYPNNFARDNGQPYTGGTPREVGHGWATSTRIIPADVTGDGFTDLLAIDSTGKMTLYPNNFARDNGQPYTGGTPREVGHGWNTSTRIIPADVTGDGFTDLLAIDSTGKMTLYPNNFARDNGQPYTGGTPREVGHGWSTSTRIIPADVTGDGFTDLLAIDSTGKMTLYPNNFARDNGQPYTGGTPREVGHGWSTSTRIIPADVTGDGFTDLLAIDSTGKMTLYPNNFARDNGQPYTGGTPREVGHGWATSTRILV
ncbi:FG-GAP-like repeat-containing protein [[Actinomadura] parvosata]|uniref:FG-GAP-like repeat-containing protein n=1 Tax=[Actinomadura] parvosata TaxID=1955412 RepID=UPI00406CA6AD